MTGVFAPEQFAEPLVSPDTATLFRRTPYISNSEYQQAPTAVATTGLVPGGSEQANEGALSAVIMRASGWVDLICFHAAAGTLAASPTTESAWVQLFEGEELRLICNYKPILAVTGLAVGGSQSTLQSAKSAENLTIQGPVIFARNMGFPRLSLGESFGGAETINGKLFAVWTYINGYPHTTLAKAAKAAESTIEIAASEPGGTSVYGIYEGTQLTIHDGANTEVIVVSKVEGLKLKLKSGLAYAHAMPVAPNTTRITAIPWTVEQACILLTSCLIKTRGTRAMTLPSQEGGQAGHSQLTQAGGIEDFEIAYNLLKPLVAPMLRST